MILTPATNQQLLPLTFKATCSSLINIGDVVYILDDFEITKVNIEDINLRKAISIGIVVRKKDQIKCLVQGIGIVYNIYNNLTPGRRLFVNPEGRLSENPPLKSPLKRRICQEVGYVISSNSILINPKPPILMEKL